MVRIGTLIVVFALKGAWGGTARLSSVAYRDRIYSHYVTNVYRALNVSKDDRAYATYAAQVRRTYLPYLPLNREAAILDCGAGVGYFLAALRDLGYDNLVGVESGREQVDLARKRDLPIIQDDVFAHLRRCPVAYEALIAELIS